MPMKIVLAILLLLAAFALRGWWTADADVNVTAGFSLQVAARSGISEVVTATGVIKPRNGAEVQVGSRLSGVLEKLHVDVGDAVTAGQLLAELDGRELQANLALIEARLTELDAQLVYSRMLLASNRAVAAVAATDIAALETEVAINEARLQQALAERASAALRLAWTRVTAPISGTIASVSTRQGETIAASFAAPTFLTIIDLGRLEIQAYVDEADIGKIVPQQPVRFSVDTWPGVSFTGRVGTIYPRAEIVNNVVNYIVIIAIEAQPGYLLRPEMTTHLQFVISEVGDAIVVPRGALFSENGGNWYLMLPAGDGWEKRSVQPGIVTPTSVEITAGLDEGSVFASDRQNWLALSQQGD
jgi:RND family efflux transporter MFP subunit